MRIKSVLAGAIFVGLLANYSAKSQVEHVPVANPVYYFLEHAQVKGLLPHFSIADLPMSKAQITDALKKIARHESELSWGERDALHNFEAEFGIEKVGNAVVFYSSSDSVEVISSEFLGNRNKYIYRLENSSVNFSVVPLGSIDARYETAGDTARKVLLGNLGVRIGGTIDNMFGFYLQATNGTDLGGSRALALEDLELQKNVKFAKLNSDFDFSESHVAFAWNWLRIGIGRETRIMGSGLNQKTILAASAPPFTALTIGAQWENFEYKFMHGDLTGKSDSAAQYGFNSSIPSKYFAEHRFALRPEWGEIGFSEMIIYSERQIDWNYLNPLSFFKSLEHALHDRDNALMGLDWTVRPVGGLEIRGSYLLDDMVFSEIGKNYWSNKSTLNSAVIVSATKSIDIGVEYARVEPFTFTHFNTHNSVTNDEMLLCGILPPNSDQTSLSVRWFGFGRYPVRFDLSYTRHGENIYDAAGNLLVNVGGSLADEQDKRKPDPTYFLGGNRKNVLSAQIQAGWEFSRGFNVQGVYRYSSIDEKPVHFMRVMLAFSDF